jgi:hypothetical protein
VTCGVPREVPSSWSIAPMLHFPRPVIHLTATHTHHASAHNAPRTHACGAPQPPTHDATHPGAAARAPPRSPHWRQQWQRQQHTPGISTQAQHAAAARPSSSARGAGRVATRRHCCRVGSVCAARIGCVVVGGRCHASTLPAHTVFCACVSARQAGVAACKRNTHDTPHTHTHTHTHTHQASGRA